MTASAKNRGMLYVAFGEEYAKVGAASARAAADVVRLPVHVLTNCDAEKHRWPKDPGTTFKHFSIEDDQNRILRVTANEHSPFDETLMIDADCLITDAIAKKPFEYLTHFDLVGIMYRPLAHYKEAAVWDGVRTLAGTEAVRVIVGGVLYWRRCWQIHELFHRWRQCWEEDGRRNDMPALWRAIWGSNIRFWPLLAEDGWLDKRQAAILHEVGQTVPGLPEMKQKHRPPRTRDGKWEWVETNSARRERMKLPARPAIRHAGEKFSQKAEPNGQLLAAEIGVWKGDHAEQLLAFLHPHKLYLIDPWDSYDVDGAYGRWILEHRGAKGLKRWTGRNWRAVLQGVKKRFEGRSDIQIVRARSDQTARLQKVPPVHVAYLDGRKDYDGTLRDLRIWWRRVLPGGVLAGHDFEPEREPELVAAVMRFSSETGVRFENEETDFWLDKPAAPGQLLEVRP